MSAFVPRGKKGQRIRVTDLDGRSKVMLCGTPDRETAEDMEAMVHRFHARRGAMNRYLLSALVDRRVKLTEVYDADCLGTLEELVARLKADADVAADPDLSPLVAEWNGRGARKVRPRYVKEVRRFIPEGERFPLSEFRRGRIAKFLSDLPVTDQTRNRYKAALSQFARWLIQREYLEDNPVRYAGSFSEPDPRTVWLTAKQAKALITAMESDARPIAALMAVTGAEWQAVERAHKRDVDSAGHTFHARGGKTKWRNRVVEATDDPAWAWAWPIVTAHAATLSPGDRFTTMSHKTFWERQHEAAERVEIEDFRPHDWRHTYAVNAIKRGDDHQAIKRQLGHKPNSMLLYTTYGVYIDEAKRLQDKASSSTPIATPLRKRVK